MKYDINIKIHDNNYYYDIIRKNIRKFRKEKDLTQKELAYLTDLSEDYICEIKHKGFSIVTLGRIADVLEVDIICFFEKLF